MPKRSPPLGVTTRGKTIKKLKLSSAVVALENDKLGAGGFGEVSGKNYADIIRDIQKNKGVSHKQILVKKTYHRMKDVQQAILMDARVNKVDPERIYLRAPINFQHNKSMESKDHQKQYLYMRNQGYSLDKEKHPESEVFFRGFMGSFHQLLIGLILLQNQKMVHGDIKASNITVDNRSPEEPAYKPFTLGLIDFDLLADTSIKQELHTMKHPMKPYFLRPLELYYDSSIKKFVLYPIQRELKSSYQHLLSLMFIYRYSITPMVKKMFSSLALKEQQWIRYTMLGIMARINFSDTELNNLLIALNNAETQEKNESIKLQIKHDIENIKFISFYWKALDKLDLTKITSIPYLDAFWKVYGPGGTHTTSRITKDWTKIDIFGLGLVAAQYFFSSPHSSTIDHLLRPFLLSMVHPDPSKRLNAKQALQEWLKIIKSYDISQYKRILREIDANDNLGVDTSEQRPIKRIKFQTTPFSTT
jgi:serine/threonine protein kinase